MNPVDSDLEEGEILDDSPSSPCISNKKRRELPRRYVVHEKSTPIHKHKKDCKHSIHYHAKKLSKLKKSPKSKERYKKHRKSNCPHDKPHKLSDKNSTNVEKNFSRNGHSFSDYSLIAEMKSTFRHHLTKKQNIRYSKKPEKNISETENIKTSDNFCISEIGKENKDFQPENNSSLCGTKNHDKPSDNVTNDLLNRIEKNTNNDNVVTFGNSPKDKNEESEDEEELRRIALATCAKRKAAIKSSENLIQNLDNYFVSAPEWSEMHNVPISHSEIGSPASDNYEIVDMEVDEDTEASVEILENSVKEQNSEYNENLFVIDTKPSADFEENMKKCTLSELQTINNSSDDEFETDMLRAELIKSLCHKKSLQDECTEIEVKLDVDIKDKQVPILPKKKHVGNYKKPNINFYRKQLRPGKHILRKNVVKKLENLKCNVKKPPSPVQVNKPSERLIIALNDESSSDSEEDSVDSVPENPVASIEALISDCRQKSDSSEKPQEAVTHVPKKVACLSKAQQEEYSSLVKILAEKEKTQGPSDSFQHKNGSVRSQLDEDLKLLEEKLTKLEETLKKENQLVGRLSEDINLKKLAYMKSKLSAEHLKEQYFAAEKVKKADLCAWSKACSDFKSKKKDVLNLTSEVIQFRNLCSKVGSSVKGHNYSLPSLPTGDK